MYIYAVRLLIVIIAFFIWGGICIQWYVCGIKELCNEEVDALSKVVKEKKQATDTTKIISEEEKKDTVIFSITEAAIYFPFAKSEAKISKNKVDSLKTIAAELKQANAFLQLYGNTDEIGTDENNLKLGEDRAQWVKNVLQSYGLGAGKIAIESKGETQPISQDNTESGRAKNRRVDIIVKTK